MRYLNSFPPLKDRAEVRGVREEEAVQTREEEGDRCWKSVQAIPQRQASDAPGLLQDVRHVTSTLAGFLFNLDQSNVLKDIRMLEPLVKECIPIPKKVYKGAKRARTPEEVEQFFPGFKAFIDGTEQEIPRPKNAKKRKTYYSGKRKKHTVKTQLTVNGKGAIVHKTRHARGRRDDYDIFKQNRPDLSCLPV